MRRKEDARLIYDRANTLLTTIEHIDLFNPHFSNHDIG